MEVDEYNRMAELSKSKNEIPLIRINRYFKCRTVHCAPHVYTIEFNYHPANFEDFIRQKATDLASFVNKHRRDM